MNKITAILMSTAALVAGIELASAGSKPPAATSVGSGHLPHLFVHKSKSLVLYDQNNDDSGVGIVSQNFESSFDQYDSQAADDFTVPSDTTWVVQEVDVAGVYFNGSGPARSEHVFFYKNRKGLPGKLIGDYDMISGADNFGSFAIKLPKGQKLHSGTYWVSVQINMDFFSGGEWGWDRRNSQNGFPAAWRNPGGGFGVCTDWSIEVECIPTAPAEGVDGGIGGDHPFSLRGRIKGGVG